MADNQGTPNSSIVLYTTADGSTRIQCRFDGDTVWLTQVLMAELFQKDVRTINEHLQNIFAEGELNPAATIRKFRIVRREGSREVASLAEFDAFADRRRRAIEDEASARLAEDALHQLESRGKAAEQERAKAPPRKGPVEKGRSKDAKKNPKKNSKNDEKNRARSDDS